MGAHSGEPTKLRALHAVAWNTLECPSCGADWRGVPIDECERDAWGGLTHHSKIKWARDLKTDLILVFKCPVCGAEFANVPTNGSHG